jgi:hypothetical protein
MVANLIMALTKNIWSSMNILSISPTLLQRWSAIHWPKSLWDLKNEMNSLHFSDFTMVKIIIGSPHFSDFTLVKVIIKLLCRHHV